MTPTPRAKLSASERLALVQQQANRPVQCEKCGSNWFSDVSFQQYSGSAYATTPGGDMQVISSLVHRIRVCLCGHPFTPNLGGVRPGRTAASEVNSFMDSFNAAKEYLNSLGKLESETPEALAKDFPVREEFQALTELVEQLKKRIEELEAPAPVGLVNHTETEFEPAEGNAEVTTAQAAAPRRGRPPKSPTTNA